MSATERSATVARRVLGRLVAYCREFALVVAFAVVSVAVVAPTLIATGAGIYWVSVQLEVEGLAYTVYFGAGALLIMFVFAMLHRVVQFIGRMMLGGVQQPYWRV